MIVFRDSKTYYLKLSDTSIRPGERSKMQEFHDELVHPEFQLYLLLLSGALPRLASINTQLQKSDLDLFTAYLSINWFLKVFLEPILHNVEHGSYTRKKHSN